jgi:hypothetical protein
MKTTVLAILFGLALLCQTRAADEPQIPQALNTLLPGIHPGMSVHEVEGILSKAYPQVSGQMSDWSGTTGYVDYRLDDRFSLSVSSVNHPDDKLGVAPGVGTDLLFYLYDWPSKRRLDLKVFTWDDTNTVVAQARSSVASDPIDALVAKLSAEGGLWQNDRVQPVRLPETAPSEQLVKQILAMNQVTNYTILVTRPVNIRGGSPDVSIAALIRAGLSEKIVLFYFMRPGVGWWSRIYDPVLPPEVGPAENLLKNFNSITNGMTRDEVEKRLTPDGGLQGISSVRFIDPQCPGFKINVEFDVQRNAADQNRALGSGDDKVIRVSIPYHQQPSFD